MAKSETKGRKYAKYVNQLGHLDREPTADGKGDPNWTGYHGKMAWPPLSYNRSVYNESTIWCEILMAYKPGHGWGLPHQKGTHWHKDFDETFLYFGTDPLNQDDLGGEVEMWIGQGEEAEKYIITKPTAVTIPKGLPHNPVVFRKINNPDRPIITVVVARQAEFPDREYLGAVPPGFKL
jgi:hypothetical protein